MAARTARFRPGLNSTGERGDMRALKDVENFGGTDADNDDILLQAFEDHEAYVDIINLRRHMIIGKKGSGKSAIFKKIITTKSHDFFAYGHTFSDYPWHYRERQARVGIPDFDKYTHSWKYLIDRKTVV